MAQSAEKLTLKLQKVQNGLSKFEQELNHKASKSKNSKVSEAYRTQAKSAGECYEAIDNVMTKLKKLK